MARPFKTIVVSANDRLPPVGDRVIVARKDARCLGYRNRHGLWRDDAEHDGEFQDFIGWLEVWITGNAGNIVRIQAP